MSEPGIAPVKLTLGAAEHALAWTKRSEALLSAHGYDVLSLVNAMRHRRRGFHALCLGIYAALPRDRQPEDYLDLAEPLADPATQVAAFVALSQLIRTAYPPPAEKKSALTDSSAGLAPSSGSGSAEGAPTGGTSRRSKRTPSVSPSAAP